MQQARMTNNGSTHHWNDAELRLWLDERSQDSMVMPCKHYGDAIRRGDQVAHEPPSTTARTGGSLDCHCKTQKVQGVHELRLWRYRKAHFRPYHCLRCVGVRKLCNVTAVRTITIALACIAELLSHAIHRTSVHAACVHQEQSYAGMEGGHRQALPLVRCSCWPRYLLTNESACNVLLGVQCVALTSFGNCKAHGPGEVGRAGLAEHLAYAAAKLGCDCLMMQEEPVRSRSRACSRCNL